MDRASTRLESGQRIARFLDEDPFFPQLSGEDFSGSLDVRANRSIVVVIVLKIEGGSFRHHLHGFTDPTAPGHN